MRPFKKMTKEESEAFWLRNARIEEECEDYLMATYGRVIWAWSGTELPTKRTGWWWRYPLAKVKWFFKKKFMPL